MRAGLPVPYMTDPLPREEERVTDVNGVEGKGNRKIPALSPGVINDQGGLRCRVGPSPQPGRSL